MQHNDTVKTQPPGRIKIINAMRTLLETKDFSSIKIAELAHTAGVTEPLIYKYFRDKRDVLHCLLQEYLETKHRDMLETLEPVNGSLNKLEKFIHAYINAYDHDRVLARVVLLEVSNSHDYYRSESYRLFKKYGKLILDIIIDGVNEGVIRDDIAPLHLRNLLLGCIDRACMNPVIFNKEIDVDPVSRDMTRLIFDAICVRDR